VQTPCHIAADWIPRLPRQHTDGNASAASVLVVDDDVSLAKTLGQALRVEGFDVTLAHDGAEALERVREHIPTLVILDVQMPVMDGFAFLETFRTLPGCEEIPVLVATSARDTADVRRRTDRQGVVLLMPKPFDLDVLVAAVTRLTKGVEARS